MRRLYPSTAISAIAQTLNRSPISIYQRAGIRGLHRTADFIASTARARTLARTGEACGKRFTPGHRCWNAGMKGLQMGGASIKTQFKKGHRPQTWVPLGSLRIYGGEYGYHQRKVADTGDMHTDWKCLHVLKWERYRGKVPRGHVVIFRDKDRANIKIANLECISRAELARRNNIWANYPPELARLIQLKGALQRQINKRERACKTA